MLTSLVDAMATHEGMARLSYPWHTAISNCYNTIVTLPRTLCNAQHLFVCLSATLRKHYWTHPHDNVSVDKKELIKFWKSPTCGSGSRNFLKDSSTLQDRACFYQILLGRDLCSPSTLADTDIGWYFNLPGPQALVYPSPTYMLFQLGW